MTLDLNPEFGYELVCSMPYAYWLKQQGEYVKVVTSKGMKPFYWFCDEVEEKYNFRSIDNHNNGVQNLPNNWIHHNSLAVLGKDYSTLTEEEQYEANGWLDYSKWIAPPLCETYSDFEINLPDNYVVISNRFNFEHGKPPVGYFDIEFLYNAFNYFKEKGYNVIYKRPDNTEFATDPNEFTNSNITANVEGLGVITDYQLTEYYDNVFLLNDIIDSIDGTYNEAQLKIFARSKGFIAMGGGSSILCSYFNKPVIIYVNTSRDIRPGYFEGNSYFNKLSNAKIIPVIDTLDQIKERGYRDYSQVYLHMKNTFYEN
jgi:hypothetical protein